MKILLIFNPRAAHGKAKKHLPKILQLLENKSIKSTVLETKFPHHASELVKNADFSPFDGIISAGGDGTLFDVINGYFQKQL